MIGGGGEGIYIGIVEKIEWGLMCFWVFVGIVDSVIRVFMRFVLLVIVGLF